MDTNPALLASKCTESFTLDESHSGWCPPYWDHFLCWPPTENGTTAELPCPIGRMSRASKKAFRVCDASGNWAGEPEWKEINVTGYSNYSACIVPHMWSMLMDLGDEDESNVRVQVAELTRHLEFCGYSISTIFLVVSLSVFFKFRSLRNARTRLHINLLLALLIHSVMRLILYTDLAITFSETFVDTVEGIHSIPFFCEGLYTILEFSKMATFSCMLMEGIYLQNLISVQVFRVAKLAKIYIVLGWILPVPLTLMWMTCMIYREDGLTCWWGYHADPCYWILQIPRLTIIVVNSVLLVVVIRVLVTKLRTSRTPELHQVRKATKAALVLLPLLGVPNIAIVIGPPSLNRSWPEFAIWAFLSHLIVSFQGLVVAILFCLTNKEVQSVVRKKLGDLINGGPRVANRTSSTMLYRFYRRQSPFSINDQTTNEQVEAMVAKDSVLTSTNL